MEREFVVNHTIFQTEILALLDSWVKNTVCQNAVHKNIASPYIFLQT